MNTPKRTELGLTIPLQRHLGNKALPYGQEPNRRFLCGGHWFAVRLGTASGHQDPWTAGGSIFKSCLGAAAERLAELFSLG